MLDMSRQAHCTLYNIDLLHENTDTDSPHRVFLKSEVVPRHTCSPPQYGTLLLKGLGNALYLHVDFCRSVRTAQFPVCVWGGRATVCFRKQAGQLSEGHISRETTHLRRYQRNWGNNTAKHHG